MATPTISPSLLLLPAPRCGSRASSKLWFGLTPPLTSSARPRRDGWTWKRRFGGALLKRYRLWQVSVAAEHAMPPEIIPAAAEESAASTVVSALLFVAFIGLFMLTVGVIYLAVQDFLQKRERDKFEKEEAEKMKKGGKKAKAKARTGPRGFGQKIEEDEE
ncbi:unnamed protein product [Musa acuminata subsp. burmannicoides]